jgi:GNAT superfamily N-acetyltransferase
VSVALQLPSLTLREPTQREVRRFIRRAWLRNFGPVRNDRGEYTRRWVSVGRHKMCSLQWASCYTDHVDALLARGVVVVAEHGGRAVAWACYEPTQPISLHFVFVDPQHRGKGYGRYLHDAIVRGRAVTYTHQTRREDG